MLTVIKNLEASGNLNLFYSISMWFHSLKLFNVIKRNSIKLLIFVFIKKISKKGTENLKRKIFDY